MVPGFFSRGGTSRHGRADRPYTALRNVEFDDLDLDEMIPLKGMDGSGEDGENGTWRSENGLSGLTARLSAKNNGKSRDDGSTGEGEGGGGEEMELVGTNSETGSQHFEKTTNGVKKNAGKEKTLAEGMKTFLLPAAAITADIVHYPLVQEGGEGVTIDDWIREDVVMHPERMRAVAFQILVPFLVAGLGMVGAGMVLDIVQHWAVFEDITELFVMVPALLGLKGNLEMTLAARLSTALNTGSLTPAKRWKIIGANLALTQAQAVVVGFLASMFAVFIGFVTHHTVDWGHALLLCGAASATTAIASSALGGVMVGVILLSEKWKINPDNIATPIAASLGDVITLGVLSGFSLLFYSVYQTRVWFVGPVVVLLIVWTLLPLWVYITKHVAQTRTVLRSGWIPVISAMLISSGSGTILEKIQVLSRHDSYKYFLGLPVFQPVMNGVAGNLVAVQASRISTHLHMAYGEPGNFPGDFYVCPNPFYSFCARNYMNARTARVLLLILIPGHLIFIFAISFLKAGHTTVTLKFIVVFIFVALIQVATLLYIAEFLTHFVWKRGIDPDSFTIPYLTSLGDLSGTGLLVFAFWFLYVTGDRDQDVGD